LVDGHHVPPGGPPGLAHAHGQASSSGEPSDPLEPCRLVYGDHYLIAQAVPRGAASWELDLRSPGLTASQGGGLPGASPEMITLSELVLVREPRGRGLQGLRSRPLFAELIVRDRLGRIVCRDEIRTRGAPL